MYMNIMVAMKVNFVNAAEYKSLNIFLLKKLFIFLLYRQQNINNKKHVFNV